MVRIDDIWNCIFITSGRDTEQHRIRRSAVVEPRVLEAFSGSSQTLFHDRASLLVAGPLDGLERGDAVDHRAAHTAMLMGHADVVRPCDRWAGWS